MKNIYCVFFRIDFYGYFVCRHVVTDAIGSSFARKLIEELLAEVAESRQRDCFKSLLSLAPFRIDLQKSCFCSILNVDMNHVMKEGKLLEYEVGNILFAEREKIIKKLYSPSVA